MLRALFPYPVQGRGAWGLLLLRLVFGAAFLFHGYGKIVHAFSWMPPGAPIPSWLQALAALSEFGGGAAMILGLLTPLACLGLFCTMSVALFMVHLPAHHPFVAQGPGPSYELALVYWVIALLYLLIGPGAFSLDAILFKPKV